MSAPLLQLLDLRKAFQGVQALRGVSFALQAGEIHALVGENGAGKSTLIKIVAGAITPDAGTLHVAGRAVPWLTPAAARALGVATIYQQPALFPALTVAENIALALERPGPLRVVRWSLRRARAAELLARIGAHISPDALVCELSMPEQQLVEIARAVGSGARIVIMDEPTASLTQPEVVRLLELTRQLRGQGVGIIYVSHRLDEVLALADRVTVLRDGQSVLTCPASATSQAELIARMVGREVDSLRPAARSEPGEVVLAVERLRCRALGLEDATLQVRAGEVVGLAGLVGAGRTELARVLFGLAQPDGGAIRWRGRPVRVRSPREAMELGIAYLPEDRRRHGVVLEMPIAANVSLSVHRRVFPGGWLRFGAERRLADDFIARLAIKAPSSQTLPGALSGGNQQKVALTRPLASQPKLLILDEPTQGIDVGAKAEIHKLVGEWARQGMAVLMISSDLPEILGSSDRIVVMRGGRVAAHFDRAAATEQRVLAAALGHAATDGPGAPAC